MSIRPIKSTVKGIIEFYVICECGKENHVAVKPGSIAIDVKLMGRRNKVLDTLAHPTFRPPRVA